MVEMMAAGMMRDSLYFLQSGDNWLPTFTAPSGSQVGFQVPFRIPSGNTGQLNMLGAGNLITVPGTTSGAAILGDIQSVVAAYAAQPLRDDGRVDQFADVDEHHYEHSGTEYGRQREHAVRGVRPGAGQGHGRLGAGQQSSGRCCEATRR